MKIFDLIGEFLLEEDGSLSYSINSNGGSIISSVSQEYEKSSLSRWLKGDWDIMRGRSYAVIPYSNFITPREVIYNDPATIVFWEDGTKTVVKCQPGDSFSKELGLAMAFVKKVHGNVGNYNDVFRKWAYDD